MAMPALAVAAKQPAHLPSKHVLPVKTGGQRLGEAHAQGAEAAPLPETESSSTAGGGGGSPLGLETEAESSAPGLPVSLSGVFNSFSFWRVKRLKLFSAIISSFFKLPLLGSRRTELRGREVGKPHFILEYFSECEGSSSGGQPLASLVPPHAA